MTESSREVTPGLSKSDVDNYGAADILETYLDRLFDALGGTGTSGRRVLAEAEGHLFAAYDANVEQGMSTDAAAADAIHRFGLVHEIGASTRAAATVPPGTIVRRILSGAWIVGAVGLLCLGLSSVLTQLLGLLAGQAFLAADSPDVVYTPARCVEYLEYAPGAASCERAAIAHHFSELVGYREYAGILGVLALVVWWVVVRRADRRWRPPLVVTAIVGAAAAGLVALASAGLGGLEFVFGARDGFGATFPDAIAALVGAAVFAVALTRHRNRAAVRAPR